jgi:UDP-2,3-diacylglucosamine hydrolase
MRFDVPVIGLPTIEQMRGAGATALAVDAGRTLLFDRIKLIELADAAGIAIQAYPPPAVSEPKDASEGTNKK